MEITEIHCQRLFLYPGLTDRCRSGLFRGSGSLTGRPKRKEIFARLLQAIAGDHLHNGKESRANNLTQKLFELLAIERLGQLFSS